MRRACGRPLESLGRLTEDAGMPKCEPTDLRGRRTDLAITVLNMAAGIGVGPGVVSAIEDGTVSGPSVTSMQLEII